MSLDEPRNPHHAAAIERGEDPAAAKRREERIRIDALASLLGDHDRDHSIFHYRGIAERLNAYKHDCRVTDVLSSPPAVIHRDLQQQQTNSYSDEDSILERLHQIGRDREMQDAEERLLHGYLHSMNSAYAPKLLDRDAANADEDDRRISQERQDEAARTEAPRVVAS